MAKQSIFGRISTLLRANINAMLDSAEDPQKMLDQLVRDYTNSIADAESAIAETIGNLRLLERDHQEDVQAAAEWGNKALAASRKADELRSAGSTADADKFDNLAKIALQRQISEEREAKAVEPTIASQTEVVDKLKDGLNGMKQKLEQLKSQALRAARARQDRRGAEQGARRRQVDRRARPDERARPVRRQDPPPGGARRRQAGARRLDASTRSSRRLEDVGELTEVEARLAALKSGPRLRRRRRSTLRASRTRRSVAAIGASGAASVQGAAPDACHGAGEDEGMTRYLVVPQWQGSPLRRGRCSSSTAPRRSPATSRARRRRPRRADGGRRGARNRHPSPERPAAHARARRVSTLATHTEPVLHRRRRLRRRCRRRSRTRAPRTRTSPSCGSTRTPI